jgi:Cu(I)/Ag(I) efflux system membrane fusion protein
MKASVALSLLVFLVPLAGCSKEPWVGESPSSESMADVLDDSALEHAAKHADPRYVCPMHPQIVRDAPGSCPICGMDLVAKEVEEQGEDFGAPIVTIRPETVQNMGVRTAPVTRETLWRYIETVGHVRYAEDRLSHVHPRAEGWVERLAVRAEGDRVERGQVLFEVYAPEVVAAQEEYLVALRGGGGLLGGDPESLRASAKERLRLLEVPESLIRRLEEDGEVRRRVPVLAPQDGVVTRLGIREGMYVTPRTETHTIADLSEVWAEAEVFEHQMAWVAAGRPAEIRVAAVPGRTWEGQVDYVYPELDPVTRTLRVRLRFPNPDGQLKPNMLADAVIYGGPKRDVLAIPREALIVTGEREAVVLALGEGRFQPVDVVTGMRARGLVEVLRGLQPGAEVVVSGQFLIDSESNLRASFRRFGS